MNICQVHNQIAWNVQVYPNIQYNHEENESTVEIVIKST